MHWWAQEHFVNLRGTCERITGMECGPELLVLLLPLWMLLLLLMMMMTVAPALAMRISKLLLQCPGQLKQESKHHTEISCERIYIRTPKLTQ